LTEIIHDATRLHQHRSQEAHVNSRVLEPGVATSSDRGAKGSQSPEAMTGVRSAFPSR
jgi:phosphotransferase system IIB component